MHISKVLIEGPDLSTLVDLFQKDLGAYNDVLIKSGTSYILIYEGYYTLDLADRLMVTMVFDFSNEGKCDIDIVSGGDEDRLLNIIWDPEKKRNIRIVKSLKEICETKKWKLSETIVN